MAHAGRIEAVNITKTFGSGPEVVRALDDVSVTIRENEFFTLLGPSGCGKTTLLRLIAGFEQPTAGTIKLDGQALEKLPPFRRPVNTVFQSYALFPHMTVAGNVAFGLEMQGGEPDQISRRVDEVLELVKLGGYGKRKPSQLSGGQQQRVALARALANRPKVLLLDEPLSALDLKLRKEMQIELKRLQWETGITFVFVTHDQGEALTMSDRVAVMKDGKILQLGTPTEIYEHPTRRFVADFIGETNFLEGQIDEAEGRGSIRLDDGGRLSVGELNGHAAGERVTVAVRPERAILVAEDEQAEISARVEDVVYFGTDTIYHLRLGQQSRFIVRVQNREGAQRTFESGQAVGVQVPADAVRVLAD
ncbi:MAG: ABC transporter ATP-binding protein [Rhodovibrionaceae bacterium]|nr:ABC transporter ATP-binding protein [Rhodovibrionaceae bacterium]